MWLRLRAADGPGSALSAAGRQLRRVPRPGTVVRAAEGVRGAAAGADGAVAGRVGGGPLRGRAAGHDTARAAVAHHLRGRVPGERTPPP